MNKQLNKSLIFIIILAGLSISFLFYITPVFALDVFSPYIYIKETPGQQASRLKSTYGLSNYYDCYGGSCSGTCQSSTGYIFGRCGSCIESCLESKQLIEEYNQQNIDQTTCPSGYSYSSSEGKCMPDKINNNEYTTDNNYDATCKNDFGQYSYYIGKLNENNEAMCACMPGYIWRGSKMHRY